MDRYMDCWCDTCNCKVTLEEVREDYHVDHRFSPIDRAALEKMQELLIRAQLT